MARLHAAAAQDPGVGVASLGAAVGRLLVGGTEGGGSASARGAEG